MATVNADPEKLRALAAALTRASQQCEDIARQTQRGLDATNWRDGERTKFEAELKESLKLLGKASDRFKSKHVPVLQAKAQALEQYRG